MSGLLPAAAAASTSVKPIFNRDMNEAKQRLRELHRAWYREVPNTVHLFQLDIFVKQGRDKVREMFMKNAHVIDPRVADLLVIKGKMELEETKCGSSGHRCSDPEPKYWNTVTDYDVTNVNVCFMNDRFSRSSGAQESAMREGELSLVVYNCSYKKLTLSEYYRPSVATALCLVDGDSVLVTLPRCQLPVMRYYPECHNQYQPQLSLSQHYHTRGTKRGHNNPLEKLKAMDKTNRPLSIS
eukprot:bmy_21174T0